MQLAIYTCPTDVVLFVPALCLPPREAEDTFGPLAHAGSVDLEGVRHGAWQEILLQIERHLFASVPAAQARLLLDTLADAADPAEAP